MLANQTAAEQKLSLESMAAVDDPLLAWRAIGCTASVAYVIDSIDLMNLTHFKI
jgi:hypothetical protein